MRAFLHSFEWKYAVFAIDDRGDIWRFYWDHDGSPYIMKLIGDEQEYAGPIGVLRAYRRAFQ